MSLRSRRYRRDLFCILAACKLEGEQKLAQPECRKALRTGTSINFAPLANLGVVHQYLEGKFIPDFYIQKLSVLFRSSRFRKVEELSALFLSALTAVFKLDQVFQLKVRSVSATFASPVCVARSSDPLFSGEGRGFLSRKGPGNEVGW